MLARVVRSVAARGGLRAPLACRRLHLSTAAASASASASGVETAAATAKAAMALPGAERLWELVATVPYSHPMTAVLGLAGAQVALGGFDNIYHHELKERLPWTGTASTEQRIHCIRGGLYAAVFVALSGLHPTGAAALGLAGVLVAEAGLTLWDFVTEDATRKHRGGLPPTERVTHTLLTLNYGALLACWLPVILGDWAARPTGLEWTYYGLPTVLGFTAAAGVGAWSVRDYYSLARLARFAHNAASQPLTLALRRPRSRVLVTGGTGMLGVPLVTALLREGHDVTVLVRDRATAALKLEDPTGGHGGGGGRLAFITSFDDLDPAAPIDAVVNLAGEPLAARRWSKEQQRRLFDSRVALTRRLVSHLAAMPADARPEVLVSGSAIGYYGAAMPGGDVHEDSPPAETESLSHRLCSQWEAAAGEAAPLGVRVVQIRTGVVLGRDGGALAQMLTPFEFGLGGPMGSGKQVMPWIHIDDILRVVAEAINNPALAGAVNGTAPQPATNEELTGALAAVMRRPNLLRVPAFALKLLFGGQFAHELLLTGQRVVPRRLTDAGFQFAYPTLEGALREVVKGDTSGRAVDASASREKDE